MTAAAAPIPATFVGIRRAECRNILISRQAQKTLHARFLRKKIPDLPGGEMSLNADIQP